ncbi:hypothetical protein R84865_002018 [Carnimonas sp. R-84865]
MSMQMKSWLHQKTKEERLYVAQRAGVTVGYFWQISGGHKRPSIETAKALQDATGGELTIEGLRPDIFGTTAA